jgi:hypothetical protein
MTSEQDGRGDHQCLREHCDRRQEFERGPSPYCLKHALQQYFWFGKLAGFEVYTEGSA